MIRTKLSRILVGEGSLRFIEREIERLEPFKVGVVTNTTVGRLWLSKLEEYIRPNEVFYIGDGERFKNISTVVKLWRKLIYANFTRKSLLIGYGGGVVGDIAGFVASTFMRGMMFAQIPTTLLAQVDASIGGKTGINFYGKNLIGTFYQPLFIMIDIDFLTTLPMKEFLNGMAEVIKYGVIYDKSFFSYIRGNVERIKERDKSCLLELVKRSVEIKVKIVEEDERESGLRRILNFGHTIGHGIEKVSNYRIKHGFAVSIGMILECKLAEALTGFSETEAVKHLLESFGLPTHTHFKLTDIVKAMICDKKAWYGKLAFALPKEIGRVEIVEVDANDVLSIIGGKNEWN